MERIVDRQTVLSGVIKRVIYNDAGTGFLVADLETAESKIVRIVGEYPGAHDGLEFSEVAGQWAHHPQYGPQFKFTAAQEVAPSSVEGIFDYLQSQVDGLGPGLARRIVDRFGDRTFDVMEYESEKIYDVPGVGKKVGKKAVESFKNGKVAREAMSYLMSHGLSPAYALRAFDRFGLKTIGVVRENPYELCRVSGIGFKRADEVARAFGIAKDSPRRIEAYFTYLLDEAESNDGHAYLPEEQLIEKCVDDLKIDRSLADRALVGAAERELIVNDEGRIYRWWTHETEVDLADAVKAFLAAQAKAVGGIDWSKLEARVTYTDEQREAIRKAIEGKMLVLTGPAGSGKTTAVLGIISVLRNAKLDVAMAAPTGRAAKRMEETSGERASTIHRLLGFNPRGGFMFNRDNPLPQDAFVMDETSMSDQWLFAQFMNAVKPDARVIVVGDVHQLPSVGAGNVLRDLIKSGRIPTVHLSEIFRQLNTSQIIYNASRINRGEMIDVDERKPDFIWINSEDEIADSVVEWATELIPQRYGFDPMTEIQVLSPMYKRDAGVDNLNWLLQERLNPRGREVFIGKLRLRIGDRVMQTKNNYELDVMNGDLGIIEAVDVKQKKVIVFFEGEREVSYEAKYTGELRQAYCISCHKSQGGQFRAVVIPWTWDHFIMLQRNLLYTAVTRAQDLVVLVGPKRAVITGIRNDKSVNRNTRLAERLRG